MCSLTYMYTYIHVNKWKKLKCLGRYRLFIFNFFCFQLHLFIIHLSLSLVLRTIKRSAMYLAYFSLEFSGYSWVCEWVGLWLLCLLLGLFFFHGLPCPASMWCFLLFLLCSILLSLIVIFRRFFFSTERQIDMEWIWRWGEVRNNWKKVTIGETLIRIYCIIKESILFFFFN